MPSVEQLEVIGTEMATLTNTLEMFDTYKPQSQEDHSSDEESFHLPLLEGDDEGECTSTGNKDSLPNGKDTSQNGETEDDILNKFETTGTPDVIDPKIEESLLNEKEDVTETASSETEATDMENDLEKEEDVLKESSEKEEKEATLKESLEMAEADMKENSETEEDTLEENLKKAEATLLEDLEKDEAAMKDNSENNETDLKESGICEDQNRMDEESVSETTSISGNNKNGDITKEETAPEKHSTEEEKQGKEEEKQTNEDESVSNNLSEETEKVAEESENNKKNETMDTEILADEGEKVPETISDIKETETDSEMNEDKLLNDDDDEEKMEESPEENQTKSEVAKGESEENEKSEKTDEDKPNEKSDEPQTAENGDMNMDADELNSEAIPSSNIEKEGPDKCENSNDSSKSQNQESESDLLDISIVRDVDEDNASAIAEINNDAQTSEKDDDEQDENISDKADNEDLDIDQGSPDKLNENMDFDDDLSSTCDKDILSSGKSDSDNKDGDIEMTSAEHNEDSLAGVDSTENTCVEKEKSVNGEIVKTSAVNDKDAAIKDAEKTNGDVQIKPGKRSLSETESEVISKKMKLSEGEEDEKKCFEKESKLGDKLKTLMNFSNFMKDKKFKTKLTRSDLEQFCLQKICEAILHKTEVGELHQQIKKHEQTIEHLRKDVQQLSKQARDLEIVNKKLMSELKSQNNNKKPLVPLKITRSVGLQVKLNTSTDVAARRRQFNSVAPPKVQNASVNTRTPTRTVPTSTVTRQVLSSPQKPQQTTQNTPLLSQALQNRRVTPNSNNAIKRTPQIRAKPGDKPNASVIDLTDEDDRSGKTANVANKTITKTVSINQTKTVVATNQNKSITLAQSKTVTLNQGKTIIAGKTVTPTRTVTTIPPGVRLTPTQVKNGSITLPAGVVTSSPQLMYVVQPTSSLSQGIVTTAGGTQKAVIVNFQPTSGVLTQTINGSAVSVIPKAGNTVQLKTIGVARKHPAPLPGPPVVRVNSDTPLKPIPPKPHLSIRKTDTGIILQWKMPYNLDMYEGIASYQLYAYQETNAPPSTDMWRRVGDVKALALPMACTLTQFADKNKYYFAVRSVDVHKRIGAFSDPEEISL